jgi:hypothetical protein
MCRATNGVKLKSDSEKQRNDRNAEGRIYTGKAFAESQQSQTLGTNDPACESEVPPVSVQATHLR